MFISVYTRESETSAYLPPTVSGLRGSLMLQGSEGATGSPEDKFKVTLKQL